MNQKNRGSWLFFSVALLSVIVAFLPLARGGRMNVVSLSVAVVFFVLGMAAVRRADTDRP